MDFDDELDDIIRKAKAAEEYQNKSMFDSVHRFAHISMDIMTAFMDEGFTREEAFEMMLLAVGETVGE